MSKELKALKRIKNVYERFIKEYRDLEPKLMICEKEDFNDVETALKEYEGAKKHIKALNKERIENSIKLKALEILKRFNNYNIIQIQNQWYLLQGDSFFKSLKISITEEEAILLKEVLL